MLRLVLNYRTPPFCKAKGITPRTQLDDPEMTQEQVAAAPAAAAGHNPSHEELQYLNLIRDILSQGEHRPDRTGTGTRSLFGPPQYVQTVSIPIEYKLM